MTIQVFWQIRHIAFGAVLFSVLPLLVAGAAHGKETLQLAFLPTDRPPNACEPVVSTPNATVSLFPTFRDNFDEFDLTDTVWQPHYAHNEYSDWRARTLENNKELQIYVDPGFSGSSDKPLGLNPFQVTDGALSICARETPEGVIEYLNQYPYISGMISSRRSFLQRYGYFEIEAKLPRGQGLWPAFWLLAPGQWPPEIDAMEYLGGRPGNIELHVHWEENGFNSDGCQFAVVNETESFKRYGVLWQRDLITWYIDRKPVARIAAKPDMDQPMYMLANLAVGGSWGGPPDSDTKFPACYSIREITAWQFH
ncbi:MULTISPECIES: family 16 glycosylhydrolase [unclassified Ruegeria]|uniref:glycoside hydrolase family 16 protein n=1 Tax=unclassified Ruegeria TaxID=2625375 RepID=UPI00148909F9|nr:MULTISPECIES: glycoside hydrolase family 16 protein [unclassified Ruegeria]